MSLMGGSSLQPDFVIERRTSTGAPQAGQLIEAALEECRHHGQV
jgi:hypothetical protein